MQPAARNLPDWVKDLRHCRIRKRITTFARAALGSPGHADFWLPPRQTLAKLAQGVPEYDDSLF